MWVAGGKSGPFAEIQADTSATVVSQQPQRQPNRRFIRWANTRTHPPMDVIQGTSFAASEVEGGVVDLDSKPSDMPAPATTVCVALSAQHASVHSSAPTGARLSPHASQGVSKRSCYSCWDFTSGTAFAGKSEGSNGNQHKSAMPTTTGNSRRCLRKPGTNADTAMKTTNRHPLWKASSARNPSPISVDMRWQWHCAQ